MNFFSHNYFTTKLKRPFQAMMLFLFVSLLLPSASLAYLGLCCAHCGGNMQREREAVRQCRMSSRPTWDNTLSGGPGTDVRPRILYFEKL